MEAQSIPGYTFGQTDVARSPVTAGDVELLKATLLWNDDERYLRMAGEVLADQVDEVLELWYGYVGSHPHLVHYFSGPDGQPIPEYLERVRSRFGSGCATCAVVPTTRPGATTSTRSRCATPAPRRTAPMASSRCRRSGSAT
jgi:hypothetical protein